MLAAFFRSNQPAVLLAAPVVTALLFAPAFWQAPAVSQPAMPLAALLGNWLTAPWSRALAGIALVALVAIQLAALLNALELLDRRNHLAAVLLPVTLAGLGGPGCFDPALLGMPFVLMAMRRAWAITNTGSALSPLFDAGLLLGLAALCYLPYAFLLAVLWASASVIRPFAWREYALPALAMVLVFYLAWGVLRLADEPPWRPLLTVMQDDPHPFVAVGGIRRAFIALLILLLLLGFAAFTRSYAQSVMRGKNLRSAVMALALALAVLMALLALLKGGFPAVLLAVPAAVLVSYLLLNPRHAWLGEAAAWSLAALALWIRWG